MQRARREVKEGEPAFFFLWWRSHTAELPSWAKFLRAILRNVPNSCPPERVFSILNGSFGDDLKNARADYLEFSLMAKCNIRNKTRN